MSLSSLAQRCIKVSDCPPPGDCSNCDTTTSDCFIITSSCVECAHVQCTPRTTTGSSGGISKGAVAGAVISAIVVFAIAIALFLRYRKRAALLKARAAAREPPKDIPAPAETVLNRPDPTEKPPSELNTIRVYSTHSSTTIDLDPNSLASSSHPPDGFIGRNPFDDGGSIQTTGTEGTNVIPIALVPADSHRASTHSGGSDPSSTSSYPLRPARSPELNLNLEHVNVSRDNVRTGNAYAKSTISGISGISGMSRNSFMSSASYSSDFLNEAPMIMTPTKSTVRQVLGRVKAEVISAGSVPSGNSDDSSLRPPAYSRPNAKSPLASTSFGPSDVVKEADESEDASATDPFSDEHRSTHASYGTSGPSTSQHLSSIQNRESTNSDWIAESPNQPWARSKNESRPSSLSTQAGSVVDIATAARVNVGLNGPKTPGSANSYRTTMGRLVTPPNLPAGGTLQEQQQRALAHAQAQAQAQGLNRRSISGSSVLSATSTRADSILESFPFVPPSPISDRPIRSPPVSPLGKQSFTSSSTATSPLHQHTFVVAPPSPLTHQTFSADSTKTEYTASDGHLDPGRSPAPNRRTLGLSTGSQFSTASSGLGSFPFQIETEEPPPMPTTSLANRHRASLDTLALTSDLSSYPLGFDRDSALPPKK